MGSLEASLLRADPTHSRRAQPNPTAQAHKHLVKLYGVARSGSYEYLVTEFVRCGRQ